MQCKARLITSGNRIVSDRQPEHTHSGNVATALARQAVGEVKTKMNDMNATSSSSQASVADTLDNDVLVALPKRWRALLNVQTTRTCSDLRSSRIPRRNLESACCKVRRNSSQHQQCRGVAPPTAVTVPMSSPNRVDLHGWDSAGHPAPEITTSVGYDWSKSPLSARKYRALNDRVTRAVAAYGRAEVLVYLHSTAYLSHA